MTDKKRLRPRSMEAYPESVRIKARNAFISFCYMERMGDKSLAAREQVKAGEWDNMPVLQAIAYAFSLENDNREVAGVICTGCGSSWSDDRLKKERANNPALRSCCPERDAKAVYWCGDE